MRRRQILVQRQRESEEIANEKSQGDDHIKLIAKTITATFPIIEKPTRGRPPKAR